MKNDILYTINDWTCNSDWDLQENQSIKHTTTIWFDLDEFTEYQLLSCKDKVEYLMKKKKELEF